MLLKDQFWRYGVVYSMKRMANVHGSCTVSYICGRLHSRALGSATANGRALSRLLCRGVVLKASVCTSSLTSNTTPRVVMQNVFRGPAVTGQVGSQTSFQARSKTTVAPCSASSHASSRGDRECSTLHRGRGSSSLNHAQHRRAAVATRASRGGLITRDAPTSTRMVQPQYNADAWFYSEQGQKDWVEAMELDTLTPDLPQLLIEMGIQYDPDKLAATLSSRWPQVRVLTGCRS